MEPSEKPSPLESEFPLQDHYAPETEGEFPSPAFIAEVAGEETRKGFDDETKAEKPKVALEDYSIAAQKFLDQYERSGFFATYAKDVSLKFRVGDSFMIDYESGTVHLDGSWFHERGFSNEQILWACLHELSHFIDLTDEDMVGHGIFCTGIVAANNNEFGIVGVAPKTSVVFCKVLKASGAGNPSHIIKGIEHAIENNVDIISISFGARQDVPEIKQIIRKAYEKNIVLVAAAGNDKVEDSVNYPARYDEVISVGAVDENDQIAEFCSKGYKVDVYAPGVYITSTYLNNSYACMSGTSFATPFVAGIISLAISLRRKNKKAVIVQEIIDLIKKIPLKDFVEKYGT
jgi:subtilisin family serine protease